jgi:hypothetical protein
MQRRTRAESCPQHLSNDPCGCPNILDYWCQVSSTGICRHIEMLTYAALGQRLDCSAEAAPCARQAAAATAAARVGCKGPFRRCRGEKGAEGVFHFGCGIFATISSFFAEAALRDGFSSPCRAGTACRGPHEHLDIDSDSAVNVRGGLRPRPLRAGAPLAPADSDHSGSPFCQSGPTSRAGSCAIRL